MPNPSTCPLPHAQTPMHSSTYLRRAVRRRRLCVESLVSAGGSTQSSTSVWSPCVCRRCYRRGNATTVVGTHGALTRYQYGDGGGARPSSWWLPLDAAAGSTGGADNSSLRCVQRLSRREGRVQWGEAGAVWCVCVSASTTGTRRSGRACGWVCVGVRVAVCVCATLDNTSTTSTTSGSDSGKYNVSATAVAV